MKILLKQVVYVCMITALLSSCKKNAAVTDLAPGTSLPLKAVTGHPEGLQTALRMYGYMSIWGGTWVQYLDSVNLTQLTDVCISFINPDANGNFTISNDIAQAVVKIHSKNVRAHFSFGGGGGPAYWDNLIKPANRAQVISNIAAVLNTYGFEGVDVDLEGPRITADYNAFVIQLSDTLLQYGKVLSAALARYQGNVVSAAAYNRLDFLNVMCYDYTAGSPRSHSSFAQFQTDFNFFKTKMPAAKINMGVPGYAWEYNGNTPTTQVSLKGILQQYPKAYTINYKYPTPTKSWWFDGHPVLRQKVAYCLEQGAGGMMMWQIMHDPLDDASSLLKLMNYCAGNPGKLGFYDNAVYSFTSANSWRPMEVANGSLADWAGVQQGTWSNAAYQKWSLGVVNGTFRITNTNSGKVLDEVDETASGLGVQFTQNQWHGGGNQRYNLVPDALGYYKIVNVASSRLAGIYQASTATGAKVVQQTDANADHQKWIITNE